MAKNKPAPQPSENKPIKALTVDEVKKRLQASLPDADPNYVLKKFAKEIDRHNAQGGGTEFSSELSKAYVMATSTLSLDTHARLADTTSDKLAPLAITVAQQLIEEYHCETTAEKTLAETVANAYIRTIRYAEALNNVYERGTTSPEINKYIAVTSMELDRANRQYLTALSMLKSYKQPPVKVVFNAKNAFVAQNQQVNATDKQKPEEQNNEAQ